MALGEHDSRAKPRELGFERKPPIQEGLFSSTMALLLLGFLLALGLYYFGLFATLRDRTFLYYSGFVVGMGLYFLAAHVFDLGAALPIGAS